MCSTWNNIFKIPFIPPFIFYEHLMNIRNKVVVITGASKGLGRALALELAKLDARLVLGARSMQELDGVAQEISAIAVKVDIKNEQEVHNLAKTAIEKFGRIDIWVNNASIRIPSCPIESMDMARAHEMLETNLFGTIYGSKAALLPMKKQHSGTILNILSTSAIKGRVGSAAYCASKCGALGFTQVLRLEAAPFDIKVISIFPGGMKTNFFDEQKPQDYENFMDPSLVAQKIIENLQKDTPREEVMIINNQ